VRYARRELYSCAKQNEYLWHFWTDFFTLIQLQLPFFWHTPQMFTMSVHNTDFGFSNANIRNVTLEKNFHTYINMSVFILGIKGLKKVKCSSIIIQRRTKVGHTTDFQKPKSIKKNVYIQHHTTPQYLKIEY